jgi:monomeric isocitrate dehydrogenase
MLSIVPLMNGGFVWLVLVDLLQNTLSNSFTSGYLRWDSLGNLALAVFIRTFRFCL